ncbi:MAG TPA: polysaccharide deacetylase family protein [Candidatus Desulfaltia sp.]|nr:polysaccharide deacetylase family protein [Candidatus Desulfaltia sp.]
MSETKTCFLFSRLLLFLLGVSALTLSCARDERSKKFIFDQGGIVRGGVSEKKIALVFTGHEFAEGGGLISEVLKRKKARAGFFFSGDFYRQEANAALIISLREDGHYLGPHSDRHLLYCSWENREQLLVTKEEFSGDILRNYQAMEAFGISKEDAPFFIPPYEWYNAEIVNWAKELGLVLCNFTAGTLSNADYTTPDLTNYRSSTRIYQSIFDHERSDPHGLNGFILLFHIGTHPDRTDKFYRRLEELLSGLEAMGYRFVGIDDLLGAG